MYAIQSYYVLPNIGTQPHPRFNRPKIIPPKKVPTILPNPPNIITPKAIISIGFPEVGSKGKVNPKKTPANAAYSMAIPNAIW